MIPMTVAYLLAAIAALALLVSLGVALVMAALSRRHTGQVDRLLLLGKSSSVGEAVSAYERLNRLERARSELEAQRKRITGAAGTEGGTDVARKTDPGPNWFGSRRVPKPPTEG